MKPWLMMNQLRRDFSLTLIDVLKGEQKLPSFLAINPMGVVPYLVTDEGQGIGESNAMLWYLGDDSPLLPPTKAEQAQAMQWMFFEQSKLEPFISPARFFTTILPHERPNKMKEIKQWQDQAKPGLSLLDRHLQDRNFMLDCGYSIADISLFGYVHVIEEADISLIDYPNIARWLDEVKETPGFVPLAKLGHQIAHAA
jgi:glutathione S-transferase